MAKFIFVHGTFAKSADWPALSKGLSDACAQLGTNAEFEEIRWTGYNSVAARLTAAENISKAVGSASKADPKGPIFVIGHSHGGNALAYFLKFFDEASLLAGSAFLSTPFVAIRPRVNATTIMIALLALPVLSLTLLLIIITPAGLSFWRFFLYASPFLVWFAFGIMMELAVRSVFDEVIYQTCDIPGGNYVFLRFAGDEAAAVLSSTQLFSWVSYKISQAFNGFFRFETGGIIYRLVMGLIEGTVLALMLLLLQKTILSPLLTTGVDSTISTIYHFALLSFVSLDLKGITICLLVALSLVVFFSASLAMIIALFVFVWQAVAGRAFGWTSFITGFVVELAIEPLPFGEHQLFTLDWNTDPSGLQGIVHSWTYGDPRAIAYIQEWIVRSISLINLYRKDESDHQSVGDLLGDQ